MKSSRQALPKQVALPPSYDSVFSFPVKKSGYSGVAVYTRKSCLVPLKAEEGITGLIQPRPPFSETERVSILSDYPSHLGSSLEEDVQIDYKSLDAEGRALLVDLGLFVLVNVYCPNDGTGTEERDKFKRDYHTVLEARIRGLIKEGREVVVVGDLNACAAIDDHCEGQLMVARGIAEGLQGEEGFWGKDSRRWMRDLLISPEGDKGCMIDIVRKFWPNRKGMYTCEYRLDFSSSAGISSCPGWNTKISARETNYGTRIDFILITPGLEPWVAAADIQPHIKGSDHCPVFIDLREEIVNLDGTSTRLSDILGASLVNGEPPEPPRVSAKFWDEHKQKLLSNFFGKKSEDDLGPSPTVSTVVRTPSSECPPSKPDDWNSSPPLPESQTPSSTQVSQSLTSTTVKRKLTSDSFSMTPSTKKAKTSDVKRPKPGQQSIATFFAQPKASSSKAKNNANDAPSASPSDPITVNSPIEDSIDSDYQLALLLSQSSDGRSSPPSSLPEKEGSKHAWGALLAPTQAPKCMVHGEPAKEFTVNKPGPNKGKRFFTCSRYEALSPYMGTF